MEIPELKWNEFYILIDNELVDYKCTNINVQQNKRLAKVKIKNKIELA